MRLQDILELLFLALLWGISFLFMRVATPEFGVIPLMELRLLIGALVLLPLLLWRQGVKSLKQNGLQVYTLGVFNSALPFCLLAFATLTFTAGFTSIINATVPLWAALIAWLWLKDKLSKIAVLGLLIGFAGVMTMAWNKSAITEGNYVLALLAGLTATLFYGGSSVYSKARLSQVNSLFLATGCLTGGAIVLAVPAILLWPEHSISLKAWLCVITMGSICTGYAYVLFFRLIANIGAARAVTVTYLIPAISMGTGYLFLDEEITNKMLIGCAMILFGTALATGVIKGVRKDANKTAENQSD